MKRHFGRGNRNWAERKRVWRHPLLGKRFHDVRRGYGVFKKAWVERKYIANCPYTPPHWSLVFEVEMDGGLRYIEEGYRLSGNFQLVDENGHPLKAVSA